MLADAEGTARSTSSSAPTDCSVAGRRVRAIWASIIVDEEHRFGVKHKERLKQLKLETDVLTLTATPIPRTLHLVARRTARHDAHADAAARPLAGADVVEPWDDGLIDEGIARELDRGRTGVLRPQSHRDHRGDRRSRAAHRAAGARSAWRTARCASKRSRGVHARVRERDGGRARLDD